MLRWLVYVLASADLCVDATKEQDEMRRNALKLDPIDVNQTLRRDVCEGVSGGLFVDSWI